MREGQASRTAVLVTMGRAAAHGRTPVPRYSDPLAFEFLDDDAKQRVLAVRNADKPPTSLKARFDYGYISGQSALMAVRTVTIDDAIRAAHAPQLVVLGAGLDSRAWRMDELKDVVVFEVDHPDTQSDKRARLEKLARDPQFAQRARDVRFVPVDFAHDDLFDALAAAGHDASVATTWIWEGVVMYLDMPAIEATLSVIDRRSAPASRLVVLYHAPSWFLFIVGPMVRRMGEPLKTKFSPDQIRALLSRYRFDVVTDDDVASLGLAMSSELAELRRFARHLRIVVADRSS